MLILTIAQACPLSQWCGFKRDNSGTGRVPVTANFAGDTSLVPLWSVSLSAATGIYSGPAVGDVTGDGIPDIVVGDDDGVLWCFNGPDGTVNWSRTLGSVIYATPAIGDLDGDPSTVEIAVVASNTLYVLNGADGSTIWNRSLSGSTYNGSPRLADVNSDGYVDVVVAMSGGVYAYRGNDGSPVWSSSSAYARSTVPVIADVNHDGYPDVIVSDDVSRRLVALNGLNGSSLWSVPLSGDYPNSPAVDDIDGDGAYDIIVATEDQMYRVNEDGTVIWNVYLGMFFSSDAHESPVIGWDINGDGVKDAFQSAYSTSPALKAISGADGSTIWSVSSLVETHSPAPITVGEFEMTNPGYEILYNDHDGRLNVIDASTGTRLWQHTYGSGPFGSGYSVLADVNGDTCVDFILRGEYDSPIMSVFTSSVYGTCRSAWDDPTATEEVPTAEALEVSAGKGGITLLGRGRYAVFTTSGRKVAEGEVKGKREVALPPGSYVVRAGGETRRVVVF